MSKIKDEQLYQWKNLVIQLKQKIKVILKQVQNKQIKIIQPIQFFQRKISIKNFIQQFKNNDLESEDEFFDIFVYMIEEKTNISAYALASQFKQSFGKQIDFWISKINQWATSINFTSSLNIWNVNSYMISFVNYCQSPLQRSKIYAFRKKTSPYLTSLDTLVKRIDRTKKSDQAFFLDQAFVRYYKQKLDYTNYINQCIRQAEQEKNRGQFDQNTNTLGFKFKTQKSSRSSIKNQIKSFAVPSSQNNQSLDKILKGTSKSTNLTLDKFFKINKSTKLNNIQQVQIPTDQQQRDIQMQRFHKLLQNIGKSLPLPLQKLKQQLKQRRQADIQQQKTRQINFANQQMMKSIKKSHVKPDQPIQVQIIQSFDNPEFKKYPFSHFTFLYDPEDFFVYQAHAIGIRQIDLTKPFVFYPWINYFSSEAQFYQDMMAVSLDGTQITDSQEEQLFDDQESIGVNSYFINNNPVIKDQLTEHESISPQDKMEFVQACLQNKKRWTEDFRTSQGLNILQNFPVIPIYGNIMPYTLQGTDQNRTKAVKLANESKNQQKYQARIQNIGESMHEIMQLSQEDNSTTNYGSRNNSIPFANINTINQNQQQNVLQSKEDNIQDNISHQKMQVQIQKKQKINLSTNSEDFKDKNHQQKSKNKQRDKDFQQQEQQNLENFGQIKDNRIKQIRGFKQQDTNYDQNLNIQKRQHKDCKQQNKGQKYSYDTQYQAQTYYQEFHQNEQQYQANNNNQEFNQYGLKYEASNNNNQFLKQQQQRQYQAVKIEYQEFDYSATAITQFPQSQQEKLQNPGRKIKEKRKQKQKIQTNNEFKRITRTSSKALQQQKVKIQTQKSINKRKTRNSKKKKIVQGPIKNKQPQNIKNNTKSTKKEYFKNRGIMYQGKFIKQCEKLNRINQKSIQPKNPPMEVEKQQKNNIKSRGSGQKKVNDINKQYQI